LAFEWVHIDEYRNDTDVMHMLHGRFRLQPRARIYNSRFEESMQLNRNTQIGPDVSAGAYFSMNEDCYMARTNVGRYCSFGARTAINPFSHPTDWLAVDPRVPVSGCLWLDARMAGDGKAPAIQLVQARRDRQ
jgi:hypothetical protein